MVGFPLNFQKNSEITTLPVSVEFFFFFLIEYIHSVFVFFVFSITLLLIRISLLVKWIPIWFLVETLVVSQKTLMRLGAPAHGQA